MSLQKVKEKLSKICNKVEDLYADRGSPRVSYALDSGMTREEIVYRYRKQRGVNLGSWFVQERWICGSTFVNSGASAPAQSDLDIARGPHAKQTLEAHWDTWIQESDWKWLAERGFTAVRIPIGYYHICGVDPSVLDGTEFQGFQHVFEGAWTRITGAIEMAYRCGLGVLIDLHAAPGKQNTESHSGTSNPSSFFTNERNQKRATEALCSLLAHLSKFVNLREPRLTNLIGIELLNEPRPDSDQALVKWYTNTIQALRRIDETIPIYIGDCWRLDQYADYTSSISSSSGCRGLLVLDHHLYRCFTESDIRTSAMEHAENVTTNMKAAFTRINEKVGRVHGGVIVGEWSAALNPGSIRNGERVEDQLKNYVNAQLEVYESNACGGWFFWTYKKEWRGDKGWSLVDAVEAGVFPDCVGLQKKFSARQEIGDTERKENVKRDRINTALGNHTTYWSRYPGRYNHTLFEEGFADGWEEAFAFFDFNDVGPTVSELGFIPARAFVKSQERAQGTDNKAGDAKYGGASYWEYEHGFVQGVEAAKSDW